MDKNEITQIGFPNTVSDEHKTFYEKKNGYSFKVVDKNPNNISVGEVGEPAKVIYSEPDRWIQVIKKFKLRVEVKESICDIYYNQLNN